MAMGVDEALAFLTALVGAIEDREVGILQEGRAFDGHGAAHVVVSGIDLVVREAECLQHAPAGVEILLGLETEALHALLAEGIYIEYEPDLEGGLHRVVELADLIGDEPFLAQRLMVNEGRAVEAGGTHGIFDDRFLLFLRITEVAQGRGDGLVDDLEITAAGEFLELHQGEIGLHTCGVAIHHQADGAGGCDDRGLGVAVAMYLTHFHGVVPCLAGGRQQVVGAILGLDALGLDAQTRVGVFRIVGRSAVVAHHAEHILPVLAVLGEGAEDPGQLGGGLVRDTGHDSGDGAGDAAGLLAVIGDAAHHEQGTEIGVAQAQRAIVVAQLRNLLGGELRHEHGDLQDGSPEAYRMLETVHVKGVGGLVKELAEVGGRQVTCRIVQEHVFATGIGSADGAALGAGVPLVDGGVILGAGIGAAPGGVCDLVPERAGRHFLHDPSV